MIGNLNLNSMIQWNISGVRIHIEDLKVIVRDTSPSVSRLQVTYLHQSNAYNLRDFQFSELILSPQTEPRVEL